ncbi:MAG: delta-60 repeat domain-containing protein, partial [Planctomycetia bacterium]
SDGKIIVAGTANNNTNFDFALARLNSDGSLNTSFGAANTGKVMFDFGAGDDLGSALAVLPDDRVVVVGAVQDGATYEFGTLAFTKDGKIDQTYGLDGGFVTGMGPDNDSAGAVLVDPNGDLVVGGTSSNGSNADFALARYKLNNRPTYTSRMAPRAASGRTGTTVQQLLRNSVRDSDDDAAKLGLAVVGTTNSSKGKWQFSTDKGRTWKSIGNTSNGDALLLKANARVRFMPNAGYTGSARLKFRVWDGSITSTSGRFNIAKYGSGESSAFSAAVTAATFRTVNTAKSAKATPVGSGDSVDPAGIRQEGTGDLSPDAIDAALAE